VPQAVATVTYPDMPRGGERYLLFSKAMAPEIVNRMNAAIKALRKNGKIASLH
jgi:ABC-type amino acid transport substrate-binding protein